MNKKRLFIYIAIEFILLTALLTVQILTAVKGFMINDKSGPLFYPYSASFQLSLTIVSFIYALITFILSNKKKVFFILPLYFLIISIADVFFSWTPYSIGGLIGFLCAYLLVFICRKPKYYEYIIAGSLIAISIVILIIIKAFTPAMAVIMSLGVILTMNMITTWIRYFRTRDKNLLLIAIAFALIFISDLCVGLRAMVLNPIALNHIISFIVWPTYVIGNVLIIIFKINNSQLIESK